jgi:hypothetical protein
LLVFTVHHFSQQHFPIVFLSSYLDDLLVGGIVLGAVLWFFQNIFPAEPSFLITRLQAAGFVVFYSLLFELLWPLTDARHYADPWDVLAYFTGTLLFLIFGNKPKLNLSVKREEKD